MDENGNLNLRNWGFLEPPSYKSYLGLQLMSSMSEKPIFGTNPSPGMTSAVDGPFHHHLAGVISEPHAPMNYWMNNNHPYYHQSSYGISPTVQMAILPKNDNVVSETNGERVQMPQHAFLPKNDNIVSETNESCRERDTDTYTVAKRTSDSKLQHPKEKKPRIRAPRAERPPKKRAEIEINGHSMDISDIPTPVCSCTGLSQQCYRWGSGGWQSACCTMGMSVYPLPMSTKRRGARIAGRKMSIGAFKKVLEKLTSEGYDFSRPIDLKSYWAKHGTNKFVTIR